jgi:hypothetical protein
VGALTELSEFAITVRLNGVWELEAPTASVIPVGAEWKVSTTVFGCTETLVVVDVCRLSVAVSCSSRNDG